MPSDSGKKSKQCLVKITCDLSEIFKMTNRKMFCIAVFTSKDNANEEIVMKITLPIDFRLYSVIRVPFTILL